MGLHADQLGRGEQIVLETHEHWKHLIGTILLCAAAVAALVAVLAVAPDDGFLGWLDSAAWVGFVIVVLVFGVWPVLAWWSRSYTLTTQRLATREGVIRRTGRDIPLTRVNDVAFEQGLLDRIFRAGTLKVSAASEEGTVVLVDIPDVHAFSLQMNQLVRDAGDN